MSEAPSASAFIAFLNCEAKNCEERAKSLRETANAIEAKSPAVASQPAGMFFGYICPK